MADLHLMYVLFSYLTHTHRIQTNQSEAFPAARARARALQPAFPDHQAFVVSADVTFAATDNPHTSEPASRCCIRRSSHASDVFLALC